MNQRDQNYLTYNCKLWQMFVDCWRYGRCFIFACSELYAWCFELRREIISVSKSTDVETCDKTWAIAAGLSTNTLLASTSGTRGKAWTHAYLCGIVASRLHINLHILRPAHAPPTLPCSVLPSFSARVIEHSTVDSGASFHELFWLFPHDGFWRNAIFFVCRWNTPCPWW